MRSIKNLLSVTVGFLLLVHICFASSMASLRIRKIDTDWPQVKVYFDVLDSYGQHVLQLNSPSLSATIGKNPAVTKEIIPFNDSGDGVAYIFLVDISKSLTESEFSQMRGALNSIVDTMSEQDKVAIITFGSNVQVIQPFSNEQEILKQKISQLAATDNQTQLYKGLAKAMEMGHIVDAKVPRRRAIVTLTDGEDDDDNSIQQEQVFEKMRLEKVPTYAIGFYRSPLTEQKQTHLHKLSELAKFSGGAYFQTGAKTINDIYREVVKSIKAGFVATIDASNISEFDSVQRMELRFSLEGKEFSDAVDVRIPTKDKFKITVASSNQGAEQQQSTPVWIFWGGGILAILIVGAAAVVLTRRKNTITALPVDSEPCKMISLVFSGSNSESCDICIKDKIVFGRDKHLSQFVIEHDDQLSGVHCQIAVEGSDLFITDLASTNGTLVNGVPITTKVQLQDGDNVSIGATEFTVYLKISESN